MNICKWVLPAALLVAWFAASSTRAATPEQLDLKQIKSDFKIRLGVAKTAAAQALADFNTDADALLAAIQGGTQTLTDVPQDIVDAVMAGLEGVEQAQSDAVVGATQDVVFNTDAVPSNATMTGGFGEFDKFRAKLDAEGAKGFKKILAKVKKFVKAVPKASSGAYAVNVLVLPLPPAHAIAADNDVGFSFSFPVATVQTVAGGSSGDIAMGGLGRDTTTLEATIAGTIATVTCVGRSWRHSATGLAPGNVVRAFVQDAAGDIHISFNGIGIPVAP